ncbi:low-specificity L-threonine aldolase [Rheinheimera sp. 4Y26]|uniref:low-specificity L-threonine aldolase n=1 Tax=Rheinheimera sp. 4Y26 TaxID=2977811 RepID=UPI0021B0ED00|nr:low-specificity L-threonine aldolase [Rheinheimera sp. 4Y26]MCT6699437.1 low-specificity L-threonine aldolase [Rheinheimera sp. 4Y26]
MIDLRSDTVTRPTALMRELMAKAEVGDDVFGDDPSVNQLQAYAAELLGFEAALFAPSGTMTNLIALMSHCQRGDEAIVGQNWHTYKWEGGGMAVLGSIQPQPLPHQADGSIALTDIAGAIKPDDPHFARTRLIVVENTTGGQVLSLDYMQQVQQLAKQQGLACHIDGARIFNAATALAAKDGSDLYQKARQLVAGYDSVSVCLSKGLGAPVGSLLLGSAEFIKRAIRVRKMLGGGMRQAGILAAAGLYALQHQVRRLTDDHYHAAILQQGLAAQAAHFGLTQLFVPAPVQSNILFCDLAADFAAFYQQQLQQQGILCTGGSYQAAQGPRVRLRFVTHLDINRQQIEQVLAVSEQAMQLWCLKQ